LPKKGNREKLEKKMRGPAAQVGQKTNELRKEGVSSKGTWGRVGHPVENRDASRVGEKEAIRAQDVGGEDPLSPPDREPEKKERKNRTAQKGHNYIYYAQLNTDQEATVAVSGRTATQKNLRWDVGDSLIKATGKRPENGGKDI